jgi:dolichol-phosphate mannosyltransferase
MMNNNVIIGLPVFNEEAALPKLFEKLDTLSAEIKSTIHIVIVNDGSFDNTSEIIKKYQENRANITCLTHLQNKGLGEAMKSMFNHIDQHCNQEDILITLDADNTHDPKIIPDMIDMLNNENLDVVIASRFTRGGQEIGLSMMRKVYSRCAALFFNLFFPIFNVRDYSSGFRCYKIGYLKKALRHYNGELITSTGFECMAEILARFSKIGVKAGEYPLILQYDLKEGKSKMNTFRTVVGYFSLLRRVKNI